MAAPKQYRYDLVEATSRL